MVQIRTVCDGRSAQFGGHVEVISGNRIRVRPGLIGQAIMERNGRNIKWWPLTAVIPREV